MQRARVKDLLSRMDEQEEMFKRWEGILVGLGEQMGKLGEKVDSLMGSQGVSAPPPPQVVSEPPLPRYLCTDVSLGHYRRPRVRRATRIHKTMAKRTATMLKRTESRTGT